MSGIVAGLILGEHAAPLEYVGDAFVGLLQMTVLPYIVLSLIASFGRLSLRQSKRLIRVGGIVLLIVWVLGLTVVYWFPHALPPLKSGSLYSTTAVTPAPDLNLLDLFVPRNIFWALSENRVPAVILFSIAVGIGLSQAKGTETLVDHLSQLANALIHVGGVIARAAPLGIFAIAAHHAGTMSWDELGRLQAYLLLYTVAALFVMIMLLPALVACCTYHRYRDVWRVARDGMLTAFVTGKLIIVLPMLIEETQRLLAANPSHRQRDGALESSLVDDVEAIYLLAYPFPHLGKLLAILFIPFAAWFLGNPLSEHEYPQLLTTGLVSYFGGPLVATPFLLDLMRLPRDMFSLFVVSGIYCGRLGDAVGAMHLVTVSLLTVSVLQGRWRLPRIPLIVYATTAIIVGMSSFMVLRSGLGQILPYFERKEDILADMQLLVRRVPAEVLTTMQPNPEPLQPGESLLQRVRRRGILRVGFNEDKVPFAYFNVNGELVGFDINLAHLLAQDLGVELEFVRFNRNRVAEQLTEDHFDIVMSGLTGTLERAEAMTHTDPYLDVHLSVVVPDYEIRDFASLERMARKPSLRIGMVEVSRVFANRLEAALPNVELVDLPSNADYFVERWNELDGLLISAESGSALTLMHPTFEVVVPRGLEVSVPLFYAIGHEDTAARDFLEHWIQLRKRDGTFDELYDYWVLGRRPESESAREGLLRLINGDSP